MKIKMMILAVLAMPAMAFADKPVQFKHCTLTGVEQSQTNKEEFSESGPYPLVFDTDLDKGGKKFSIHLYLRVDWVSGVLYRTYEYAEGEASYRGDINIEMSKRGTAVTTNLGSTLSPWQPGIIHAQSIRYQLPDGRLAVASLVCQ